MPLYRRSQKALGDHSGYLQTCSWAGLVLYRERRLEIAEERTGVLSAAESSLTEGTVLHLLSFLHIQATPRAGRSCPRHPDPFPSLPAAVSVLQDLYNPSLLTTSVAHPSAAQSPKVSCGQETHTPFLVIQGSPLTEQCPFMVPSSALPSCPPTSIIPLVKFLPIVYICEVSVDSLPGLRSRAL